MLARPLFDASKPNPVPAYDEKRIKSRSSPRFALDVSGDRIDHVRPPLWQLGAVGKECEKRALDLSEGELKLVTALAFQIVT